MMIKILILCLIVCSLSRLEAQEQGVQFQELTFQEALNKAKAENKLVFVDCYTSWCGPCKYMLNNVFVLPEVGEFFNEHFVNVKYDMEQGEGRYLNGRFHVRSYPTFLMIRPDGTVQHRIVGSRKTENFMECVKRGAEERTSRYYLEKLYKEGKLGAEQRTLYRKSLEDAGDWDEVKALTGEEFKRLSDQEKCLPKNWYLYDQDEVGPQDERFAYVLAHKADFDKQIGKKVVDKRLYDNYYGLLTGLKSNAQVDDLFAFLSKQLETVDFIGKEGILLSLHFVKAQNSQNIDDMLCLLEKDVQNLPHAFLWKAPFLDFIIEKGSEEQIVRYVALEERVINALDNDKMKNITKEFFAKYRSKLN